MSTGEVCRDTIVTFFTTYGATRKYAELLGRELDADVLPVRNMTSGALSGYERIIIGTPIYAGRSSSAIRRFCEKNRRILESMDVALFITCMEEGETGELQLQRAFPDWLIVHARSTAVLGGEILLDKLKGFNKFIITKMIKQKEDKSKYSAEKALAFADTFRK